MPHLQKLYDTLKDRKDVQVVTFNVDDNLGVVAPFMKENQYTFPVIPAKFLVEQMVPSLGIPLNWILDANGVIRLERVGFDRENYSWVEQALQALEKVRAGT